MKTLILDLIDKTPDRYIIRYCTGDNIPLYGAMLLPMKIYNWYKSADISDTTTYKMKSSGDTEYTVTKLLLKNRIHMKIEFSDYVIYIPDRKFIKIAKCFCYQVYINAKIFDSNGKLSYHKYKFLNNYDTKSKAVYFTDKFEYKFSSIYKKYLIKDTILYNSIDYLEVFHENIIYEHEYIFNNKDGNGVGSYTFTIISIQKG